MVLVVVRDPPALVGDELRTTGGSHPCWMGERSPCRGNLAQCHGATMRTKVSPTTMGRTPLSPSVLPPSPGSEQRPHCFWDVATRDPVDAESEGLGCVVWLVHEETKCGIAHP